MCMPIENHLHVWGDRFLYTCDHFSAGWSSRSSLTLLVSATATSFTVTQQDAHAWCGSAALVAPHVVRSIEASHCALLALDIDPCMPAWRSLVRAMGDAPVVALPTQAFDGLGACMEAALHHRLAAPALRALSDDLLQAACRAIGVAAQAQPLDARVQAMLALMHSETAWAGVPLQALASHSCLSPDRVTHLFREQTGLSIRRYQQWLKARRALPHIHAGRPLLECALLSGFTDAAHMSRTYRQLFDVAPSALRAQQMLRLHMHAVVPSGVEGIG
jgi:AraC family transcriptional regulator of arabinose operon